MKNMKMGFIVQMLYQDGLGMVREEGTLTEWLFYICDAPKKLKVGDAVTFMRDETAEQFIAVEIERADQPKMWRAV